MSRQALPLSVIQAAHVLPHEEGDCAVDFNHDTVPFIYMYTDMMLIL